LLQLNNWVLSHLGKRQYYKFTCVCLRVRQERVSIQVILVFFLREVKPIVTADISTRRYCWISSQYCGRSFRVQWMVIGNKFNFRQRIAKNSEKWAKEVLSLKLEKFLTGNPYVYYTRAIWGLFKNAVTNSDIRVDWMYLKTGFWREYLERKGMKQ
jgi:hypothetical protein